MLHLSNFSGCIIHPGSLYNGRLNTYITWEVSKYVIVYFPKEGRPHTKNLPSTKKVTNNNSYGAALLSVQISSSCWNHNRFIPKDYGVKIKPEKDQGQQAMYLDVFSSRQQVTDNITKVLLHATPCGEHVTCISPSNPQTILRQEHSQAVTEDPQETTQLCLVAPLCLTL